MPEAIQQQQMQKISVEQFVEVLKGHLHVLCIGLSASNPAVPGNIFVPAVADAIGRVLSEASASPNIQATLGMREMAIQAFTHSLKTSTPAIQTALPANIGLAS